MKAVPLIGEFKPILKHFIKEEVYSLLKQDEDNDESDEEEFLKKNTLPLKTSKIEDDD